MLNKDYIFCEIVKYNLLYLQSLPMLADIFPKNIYRGLLKPGTDIFTGLENSGIQSKGGK